MSKRTALVFVLVLLGVGPALSREPEPNIPTNLKSLDGLHLTEYLLKRYTGQWVLPAGNAHILLAIPGSADLDKTYVEPDGSFSPGVSSYGVTTWLYDVKERRLYAPEEMPQEQLSFGLEDGFIPIAHSGWNAGPLRLEKKIAVVPKSAESSEAEDYSTVIIRNEAKQAADFYMYLAIRSLGPTGGPINFLSASQDLRTVFLNGKQAIQLDPAPASFGVTSFEPAGDDISLWAKRGELPRAQSTSDGLGLAGGAALYRLRIPPGESFSIAVRCAIRNRARNDVLTGPFQQSDAQKGFDQVRQWWRRMLERVEITAPDPYGRNMFYASVAYILMNSVDNQLRVTNVSYPVSYLRDGVFMLDAVDKAGLHDKARDYLDYFLQHPWTGAESQEGPEADAPGELCWIIGEHFRLTSDLDWLRSVYPTLQREADLILFMREPGDGETREVSGVKLVARSNRVFATMDTQLRGIPLHFEVELSEARDGLIVGRLDTGLYAGTTSVFGIAGLKAAWEAAVVVGDAANAERYKAEYFAFRQAMNRWMKTHPREFTFHAGVWPTDAFDPDYAYISSLSQENTYAYSAANDYHELEDLGAYHDFYTFFGAAHSLFRLGYTDVMYSNFLWPFLKSPFSRATLNAYAYGEYTRDERWYEVRHWPELWANVRGWTDLANCIPHGWTAAEIASLIRDLLFYEKDGCLVLAGGEFLDELPVGHAIAVKGAPTYFGALTYTLRRETSSRYELTLGGDASPPDGYILDTRNRLKIQDATGGGHPLNIMPGGLISIPPRTTSVELNIAVDLQPLVPLTISSGPEVGDLNPNQATITWTTNKLSFSRVAYGADKPYHNVISEYIPRTAHSLSLHNLKSGTQYRFQVSSTEANGDSQVLSKDVVFTTPQ
jgi:hypothetical protein